MEANENGVTAKNTYGGPLILKTVFGEEETSAQVHGPERTYPVVTDWSGTFGRCCECKGRVRPSDTRG